ncbi:relaxase/mobilization nuclease domain-containing protein (plasmid) [Bosea vestrisii]|uniref:relaxase/mobilization nuclease domain-containing protein n=1 Tax=Bosea vestrisii TaxID=151416 RepID=UPI0024DFCAFA|nr:relaxase/mobilization nuclease domain-containing protein [Bosea vestrisii]WID99909.1 relaxase/mobilization nuclease domain-containing protein [Bosea vestrisii]
MSQAVVIERWTEIFRGAREAVAHGQAQRRRSALISAQASERGQDFGRTPGAAMMGARAILRGVTITGGRDAERERRLDSVRAKGGGGASPARQAPPARIEGGALSRARRLAAGYQPAVVKVISFAHGAPRATATGQYVQRDDVALETHDGRILADREAVADEIKQWSKSFETRKESQDVVAVRLKLHGVRDTPAGRETCERAIASGFAGHRHAFRLELTSDGELEARMVVAMAGAAKERFRVRDEQIGTEQDGFSQKRLDARSEAAIKARIEAATGHPQHAMSVEPGASRHGRDGVAFQLRQHIAKYGALTDDRGQSVADKSGAREAARDWAPSLRSQSPRDTMHLMISAKAGTDVAALTNAVREFLHDRFADHKFMFGIHTDKEAEGHIHAHAVITVKNENGQKIHPNRDDFRTWREVYAQHARAQGLKIVATSAVERASSQSYGARDKAIVDVAERPRPAREALDRAYARDPINHGLIEKARQRIATARENPIRLPLSDADRRAVGEGLEAWSAVLKEDTLSAVASEMVQRLAMAQTLGGIIHSLEKRVQHWLGKEDKPVAITSEQMAKDLRAMNDAVARTTDLLDGATKDQFRETSARYLETLAMRVDFQRMEERGVQELSRGDIERLAGVSADRLIERAEAVRLKENREAADAQRLSDRAIEVERRQEGRGGMDPQSQRELVSERAIVNATQQSATREAREAAAALEAARMLAESPGQPLPNALLQTDALAKLKAQQEKVVGQAETERAKSQSVKGQRQK